MASESLAMAAYLPRLTARPVEKEKGAVLSHPLNYWHKPDYFQSLSIHRGSSKRRLLLLAGILERHWSPSVSRYL